MMSLAAIFLALLAVLGIAAILVYGFWQLVRAPGKKQVLKEEHAAALGLARHEQNPLITPTEHWEQQGVLNPAVVKDGDRLHLFYRAIGSDGVSRLGYASSEDGATFDRLPYPVFALSGESAAAAEARARTMDGHAALVASGGSWSGVEDPRAVVIDGRLYLTFSAFGGWDSLRMGVTSLALADLHAKRWKWAPPVYLSPHAEVHKNWVLFPEKILGKFAVLHSLHSGSRDKVLIDHLDSLEEEPSTPIYSPYQPVSARDAWDSTLRGAGPPPIKTSKGWLLLYHAIDRLEPSRYKLGALLLDLKNPEKVCARSKAPILAPDVCYENEGAKAGVVYACGAVVENDILTVFYGGADSVICAARHSLSKLLGLLTEPAAALSPVPVFST